ncbi:MAG: 3-isopropylmalate dehydratase small subunit [Candidatus Omnitrophica bacterium CG11_big_fil_rev_8_21_14_0_20_63_9]|nr:MAG: 3-isopropylmalate dehydratase small subunit [Candidatus Omnitrophica bacterium CG11_big_fil_rev_8_21_14_0_20_63_9]
MDAFRSHRGRLAVLDRANVDTDQIIPKQFLKSIARTGFGRHLFSDWRYLPDGKPNPDFPLNAERFKGASILVARNNFGCGSSREHAVWAIQQDGYRAVIAPWQQRGATRVPAFADIFRNNASKNALLTIELSEPEVEEIVQMVDRYAGLEATVDLDRQRVTLHLPEEMAFHFEIDAAVKERLIHGLDDIGLTLKQEGAISAFETRHNPQLP